MCRTVSDINGYHPRDFLVANWKYIGDTFLGTMKNMPFALRWPFRNDLCLFLRTGFPNWSFCAYVLRWHVILFAVSSRACISVGWSSCVLRHSWWCTHAISIPVTIDECVLVYPAGGTWSRTYVEWFVCAARDDHGGVSRDGPCFLRTRVLSGVCLCPNFEWKHRFYSVLTSVIIFVSIML